MSRRAIRFRLLDGILDRDVTLPVTRGGHIAQTVIHPAVVPRLLLDWVALAGGF